LTNGKRPFLRPLFFLLLFATIFLASCGVQPQNQNWPGLTTDGDIIYASYGPGFFAFDAAEQRLLWQYRAENAQLFFYAPPSVVEGTLIIGDYSAAGGMLSPQSITSIYGIEIVDNQALNERWIRPDLARDRIVGQPLQVGDLVYVPSADNTLFALDVNTGEEIWRFDAEFSIWAQPVYHEGLLYITSLDRNIYVLAAETGDVQWSQEMSGAISAQPVLNLDDGLIYVASFDRLLHALDINDGTEIWSASANDWIWSAPAYDPETNALYYGDAAGNVFAVAADTGAEIWTTAVHEMKVVEGVIQDPPLEIKGAIQASPVYHEDILYIASEGNPESEEGVLVALDRATGAELWQQTVTAAPLFSTPVIAGDAIVVGVTSETAVLIAHDLTDGSQLWAYAPPEE